MPTSTQKTDEANVTFTSNENKINNNNNNNNFSNVALGLFYMFLASFVLLIFIEMPLGPLIRLFHSAIDPHNEYRDICQNCSYIVNKADIMTMKPNVQEKHFFSHIKKLCVNNTTSSKSQSSNNNNDINDEGNIKKAPKQQQQSADSVPNPSIPLDGVEQSAASKLCSNLVTFYHDLLHLRFNQLIKLRKKFGIKSNDRKKSSGDSLGSLLSIPTPATSSSLDSNKNINSNNLPVHLQNHNTIFSLAVVPTPIEFCHLHCRPPGPAVMLEKFILDHVNFIQSKPLLAQLFSYVRNYGRIVCWMWTFGTMLLLVLFGKWRTNKQIRVSEILDVRTKRILFLRNKILTALLVGTSAGGSGEEFLKHQLRKKSSNGYEGNDHDEQDNGSENNHNGGFASSMENDNEGSIGTAKKRNFIVSEADEQRMIKFLSPVSDQDLEKLATGGNFFSDEAMSRLISELLLLQQNHHHHQSATTNNTNRSSVSSSSSASGLKENGHSVRSATPGYIPTTSSNSSRHNNGHQVEQRTTSNGNNNHKRHRSNTPSSSTLAVRQNGNGNSQQQQSKTGINAVSSKKTK